MTRLLPFQPEPSPDNEREPKILGFDSEAATEVLEALRSETARKIYTYLYTSSAPASSIAEDLELSLQNVRYHITNLKEAGLIEEIETWYSSRGNEMDVYAPTDSAVVLVASTEQSQSSARTALRQILSGVGILAGISLLIEVLLWELGFKLVRSVGEQSGPASGAPANGSTVAELLAPYLTLGTVTFVAGVTMLLLFGIIQWFNNQKEWSTKRK